MQQHKTIHITKPNSALEQFVHGLKKHKEESLKELRELREKRENVLLKSFITLR